MAWDDVKKQLSGIVQTSVVDWARASIPRPPGAAAVPAQATNQTPIIIAGNEIDQKYIYIGAALVGVVALYFIFSKKGK